MKIKSFIVTVHVMVSLFLSVGHGLSYASGMDVVDHSITVVIDPGSKHIKVTDTINIPNQELAGLETSGLLLNAGLQVTTWEGATMVSPTTTESCGQGSCNRYFIKIAPGASQTGQLTMHYHGELTDSSSPIEAQGVNLGGASVWYPQFGAGLLRFELTVLLPAKWKSVSQGQQVNIASSGDSSKSFSWSGWITREPSDEISLVAGPWFEYKKNMDDGTTLFAFFREDDPVLAKSYLDSSEKYIKLYSDLLGPYPYKKFAVVENHRQTGLGMASFTLLGSKVLRLPFILNSSLPHEILHNWWGNGVFVDYKEGNWSEGLTAYLADYWLQERLGNGVAYRRNTLIGYGDFVGESNDFSLENFHSRHDKSSQAIGYGKGAFLFHQLRNIIGDEPFVAGLRYFYRENKFKRASYADLQSSMLLASEQNLSEFFRQWTKRVGAPDLKLVNANVKVIAGNKFKITVTLWQLGDAPPYQLLIPFTVTQVGAPEPVVFWRTMSEPSQSFEFTTNLRPMRLDVDPSYDIFRKLHPEERPVTLSKAFGAKRGLIIYPGEAKKKAVEAYRQVAIAWNLGITPDDATSDLPTDRTVWLFGKSNRFGPKLLESLYKFDVGEGVQTRRIKINDEWYDDRKEAIVLVGNNPDDKKSTLVQIMSRPEKFPDLYQILAKKLPHYGSYSYMVFSAPDGINKIKGQWPSTGSPLSVTFDTDGLSRQAKEPPRPRPVTILEVPLPEHSYTIKADPEQPEATTLTPQRVVLPDSETELLLPEDPNSNLQFIKKPNRGMKGSDLFQKPVAVPLSSD
ncbi:MAG: M1 family peptidase [Magnetococcales bacterium]|nr:M1 family peptidase [Magnetococcales bacterium]